MSHIYLKVKIKELAEETKIIRKEELKALKEARKQNAAYSSKAEKYYNLYNGLRDHRIGHHRMMIHRAAYLAYAFIRNKPYKSVERMSDLAAYKIIYPRHTLYEGKHNTKNRYYDLWLEVARLCQKYGEGWVKDLPTEKNYVNGRYTTTIALSILQAWLDE